MDKKIKTEYNSSDDSPKSSTDSSISKTIEETESNKENNPHSWIKKIKTENDELSKVIFNQSTATPSSSKDSSINISNTPTIKYSGYKIFENNFESLFPFALLKEPKFEKRNWRIDFENGALHYKNCAESGYLTNNNLCSDFQYNTQIKNIKMRSIDIKKDSNYKFYGYNQLIEKLRESKDAQTQQKLQIFNMHRDLITNRNWVSDEKDLIHLNDTLLTLSKLNDGTLFCVIIAIKKIIFYDKSVSSVERINLNQCVLRGKVLKFHSLLSYHSNLDRMISPFVNDKTVNLLWFGSYGDEITVQGKFSIHLNYFDLEKKFYFHLDDIMDGKKIISRLYEYDESESKSLLKSISNPFDKELFKLFKYKEQCNCLIFNEACVTSVTCVSNF